MTTKPKPAKITEIRIIKDSFNTEIKIVRDDTTSVKLNPDFETLHELEEIIQNHFHFWFCILAPSFTIFAFTIDKRS